MEITLVVFARNDGRFGLELRRGGEPLLRHPDGFPTRQDAEACAEELRQQLGLGPAVGRRKLQEAREAFAGGLGAASTYLSGLDNAALERLGGLGDPRARTTEQILRDADVYAQLFEHFTPKPEDERPANGPHG